MELIDKDALVAEINRYKHKADERLKIKGRTLAEDIKDSALQNLCGNLLHFLDTLEVKEVDLEHLEQEVKDFCYEYDNRKEKWYELCPNDRKLLYNPTWANFAMSIAKYFFELGLSVSNKQIEEKEHINSPEEESNIVYKNITMIDKDGNTINAKIEQREKV